MGVEAKAYQTIGVHPAEAAEKAIAVNKALGLELLVVCGLIVVFIIVRLTLSVEKPAPLQQVVEMVHEFTGGQAEQVIGHGYERFQAYATCIFLFVLINNLTGLIPGVEMATKFPWVPLGLAVLTFGYYHYQGIRANGFGYVKQFLGPMWWLIPLMLPIEIISHCARVMSLTIRLYANMLASDLVALVFFSLVPFAVPAVFLGLHAFVACIQAYIFMLLTLIYLSQAVAHEH
jgi:F-type H+-transporting ATPase subunit a